MPDVLVLEVSEPNALEIYGCVDRQLGIDGSFDPDKFPAPTRVEWFSLVGEMQRPSARQSCRTHRRHWAQIGSCGRRCLAGPLLTSHSEDLESDQCPMTRIRQPCRGCPRRRIWALPSRLTSSPGSPLHQLRSGDDALNLSS